MSKDTSLENTRQKKTQLFFYSDNTPMPFGRELEFSERLQLNILEIKNAVIFLGFMTVTLITVIIVSINRELDIFSEGVVIFGIGFLASLAVFIDSFFKKKHYLWKFDNDEKLLTTYYCSVFKQTEKKFDLGTLGQAYIGRYDTEDDGYVYYFRFSGFDYENFEDNEGMPPFWGDSNKNKVEKRITLINQFLADSNA